MVCDDTDSMTTALDGKVAIVTGGSRGIGRHIVELLVARGAAVLFTGRDAEVGSAVASATGATFFRADARETGSAEAVTQAAIGLAGRVDILVNNAGTLGRARGVAQSTAPLIDETMTMHLVAPWMMMNAVLPAMQASGGGSIINMASVAGHRVGATSTAYSVAKAALIHLTRCAAAEFGPAGIRVNSVSPGFVATSIHADALPDDDPRAERFVAGLSRFFLQRQSLNRTGQPQDIGELVAFLASDASAFISGSDFVADGGMMWGRAGIM